MKLIPYKKQYLAQIRKIDASAAQQLEFNRDVFLESVRLAVSEDETVVYGFSYLSRGSLNDGIFSLDAGLGADASREEGGEALFEAVTALKACFTELRPKIPYETVYLTVWIAETRELYREFMEACGFRKNRSLIFMEKALEEAEVLPEENLTVRTPEGFSKIRIRQIPVNDPDERSRYSEAKRQGFGAPGSEAGLVFAVEQKKARVFAAVRADDPAKILSAVTVTPPTETYGELADIFCIPKYRRQHVTGTLIRSVLNKLREEGFLYAGMNVFSSNKEASALYNKLGFQKRNTIYEYIWP